MNLSPAHARFLVELGRKRWHATDFELSGCALELQRGLRHARESGMERLEILEQAYRECEAVLLYWTGPYELAHDLTGQRVRACRPPTALKLRVAIRRARKFALETYPEWSWREGVIGALTLVYLIGAAVRSMDERDPLVEAYLKLIETRAAWMPA